MNAIECRSVRKSYPDFSLDDLDLVVPTGSVMGLVGPNGAGKSTTLRIIMGLVAQDSGRVEVLGREMPAEQVPAKWVIGFISENMRLYGHQTLGFHLDFLRSVYPSWDDAYAAELLDRFGLAAGHKVGAFSHGQRVMAAILTVLARRPKLLVFDEPTAGLDPVARKTVLAEMMRVMEDPDRSILFSSHNTLDVEQISDHITFLDRGRVLASRDKESFLDSWRRLRIVADEGFDLPARAELVEVRRSGRQIVATCSDYGPAMEAWIASTGAEIDRIERLTLEEIFVASVSSSRNGSDAAAGDAEPVEQGEAA